MTRLTTANSPASIPVFFRACPVCASQDKSRVFATPHVDLDQWQKYSFSSRKKPENDHFGLIECPECGLLYSDPIPSLETLSNSYSESPFDSGREAFHASQTYSRLTEKFSRKLAGKNSALDVGTGDGSFLERLLELGFKNVVGIEPSLAPIASAKDSIRDRIRPGMFREQDFKAGSFSLITCFQTFEHLYDPADVCRSFYRLLEPGGGVFLVMHNRLSFSAKLLGLKSPIYDVEHLQLFSPRSAAYLLKACGFRNIETTPIMNRYPLSYWATLFPWPEMIKSRLIDHLKNTTLGAVPVSLPAGNFAAFAMK